MRARIGFCVRSPWPRAPPPWPRYPSPFGHHAPSEALGKLERTDLSALGLSAEPFAASKTVSDGTVRWAVANARGRVYLRQAWGIPSPSDTDSPGRQPTARPSSITWLGAGDEHTNTHVVTAFILVISTLLPPAAPAADPPLARPRALGFSGGFIEVIHGGVRPMPRAPPRWSSPAPPPSAPLRSLLPAGPRSAASCSPTCRSP